MFEVCARKNMLKPRSDRSQSSRLIWCKQAIANPKFNLIPTKPQMSFQKLGSMLS